MNWSCGKGGRIDGGLACQESTIWLHNIALNFCWNIINVELIPWAWNITIHRHKTLPFTPIMYISSRIPNLLSYPSSTSWLTYPFFLWSLSRFISNILDTIYLLNCHLTKPFWYSLIHSFTLIRTTRSFLSFLAPNVFLRLFIWTYNYILHLLHTIVSLLCIYIGKNISSFKP